MTLSSRVVLVPELYINIHSAVFNDYDGDIACDKTRYNYGLEMAVNLLGLRILLACCLYYSVEGCLKDLDCDTSVGQHCCMSRCTTAKVRCSQLCYNDVDCKRDHLCHQNICVACSKQFKCELKTCFNNTDCPEDFECKENKMCSATVVPKRHTFTLLPFIVIIAILGFALIVLCYTEGCWKELYLYLKRHWGRYGSVALDEIEAERREGSETTPHVHTNKSCVDNVHNGNMRTCTFTARNSQSRSTSTNSRSTQTISHSRTLVTAISQAIRNQSRASSNFHFNSIVTSQCTNLSSPNTEAMNSGSEPLLTSSQGNTNCNPSESPPTYISLFDEEYEEPPPKYEEVVNIVRVPVHIEMYAIASNGSPRSLRSQENTEVETMV